MHTKKRKESKHNTRDSHQITREENKKGLQNRKTYKREQKRPTKQLQDNFKKLQ